MAEVLTASSGPGIPCGVVHPGVHKIMWNVDPSSILRYTLAGSFRMQAPLSNSERSWGRQGEAARQRGRACVDVCVCVRDG